MVKSAREIELENCIKEMLQGVASEGMFENFCEDGQEVVINAAKLVDFPMDQIAEPVEIFLQINTSNFISTYFNSDSFNSDDFEVVSIVVKHKGNLHNLTADDIEIYEA